MYNEIPTTYDDTTAPFKNTPTPTYIDTLSKEEDDIFSGFFGRIYYPVIVVVGIASNIFNLIILSHRSMLKHSSSIYLKVTLCLLIMVLD